MRRAGNIAWQDDMIMDALFGTMTPIPEQADEADLTNYVDTRTTPHVHLVIWHFADGTVVNPRNVTALGAELQAADVW